MYIPRIFLTLALMFLTAHASAADVWVCSQTNGGVLYTNEPQKADCQKFEPASELIYMSPDVVENVPEADSAYDRQETHEVAVGMQSTGGEQPPVPPYADDSYEAQQNNFWSREDNHIFTTIYTYAPGFYRNPSSRPGHFHDSQGRPIGKHETTYRVPLLSQTAPSTMHPDFPKRTGQSGVPMALPQSVQTVPPEARHYRETSSLRGAAVPELMVPNGTTAQAPPSQSSQSAGPSQSIKHSFRVN